MLTVYWIGRENVLGPVVQNLTTSLVNDSLKFTSNDMQICWNFLLKNVSSFCSAKATHIFSAKNIRILYIESAKTLNEMSINELVKLTTLWTTGPWNVQNDHFINEILVIESHQEHYGNSSCTTYSSFPVVKTFEMAGTSCIQCRYKIILIITCTTDAKNILVARTAHLFLRY